LPVLAVQLARVELRVVLDSLFLCDPGPDAAALRTDVTGDDSATLAACCALAERALRATYA
jgi:hypothetical protein